MKSKNTINRMLAQYLQNTKLPVSLFWMSSAFLLPQAAVAQETQESHFELAVEEPASEMPEASFSLSEEAQPQAEAVMNPALGNVDSQENRVHNSPAPVVASKSDMPCLGHGGKAECCSEPIGCCNPVLKARVTCCPAEKKDDCGRPIPHQRNCCCCNCINAIAPLEDLGIAIDFLYFKPIEEGLVYAETNSFSFSPPGKGITQKFDYRPGWRADLEIPLGYDEWEIDTVYTYFHTNQPATRASDPGQFLYMTLFSPYYPLVNGGLNVQCGYVKGKWTLNMDVVDLEFKRPFLVGKTLMIEPVFGIRSSFIRQRLTVNYENIYLNPQVPVGAIASQQVVSKSKLWGVGPDLGMEMKFLIPRRVSLFLRGSYAAMLGQVNTTTKYDDALLTTGAGTAVSDPLVSIIRSRATRLFTVVQLQGAISKWWMIGRCASIELMVGWETQFWEDQNQFAYFNSMKLSSVGESLTLQGPFGRVNITF